MPSRYRSAFSWVKRRGGAALVASALVASALGSTAGGCGAEGGEVQPGCRRDEPRAERLLGLLARETRAAALLDGERPPVCFVDGPGVLVDGRIALPAREDDATVAARLAHLLHHARHGRGLVAGRDAPGRTCDEAVEEALAEEAAAHVLELELQAALGAAPSRPFENAAEILALPGDARVEALLAYLRAHPDGGGGYEPLARDYRARCQGR